MEMPPAGRGVERAIPSLCVSGKEVKSAPHREVKGTSASCVVGNVRLVYLCEVRQPGGAAYPALTAVLALLW